MKKTLIAVLGMAMIAPMAWAQTNVISQNAVGYVKLTLPANGGLVLARYDFLSLDGSPTMLSEILGTDLPDNTTVFVWDRANQQYNLPAPTLINFLGTKSWNSDLEIQPGDAFFILNGATAPAADVYLLGEVPGANNASDTVDVTDATSFVGYPYPAAVNWEDTEIANVAGVGSVLFRWDPLTQGYVTPGPSKINFLGTISWSDSPTIVPGEGFFVTTAGAVVTATEVKPYAWP